MNGYDFDQTIYDGNSFVDFYFYCLLRRLYIVLILPYQFILSVLYVLHVLNRKQYKQAFHCYLFFVFGKMRLVDKFWQTRIKKIKAWYLAQKKDDDVIVSASPEFFLRPACDKLGIKHLIATDMDMRTGLIRGENCCRQCKVKMFQQRFGADTQLASFYSDSKNDIPMMLLARKKYFVDGNDIQEYQA
ncbi:MAG: HAD-IB family phosphatase [Clostridia bacterium]|nr:HAD-IB family phosphatase [Clostridia bacterium]